MFEKILLEQCPIGYSSLCRSDQSNVEKTAICPASKVLRTQKDAIFSIIHVKVKAALPTEIECSCVPVNVLKDDIDEGRSPFGEDIEDCFQVDSKIVYQNNSFVNGKS